MARELDQSDAETRAGSPWGRLGRVALIAAALGLLVYLVQSVGSVSNFAEHIESAGIWGPVLFILGYALSVVAFVPGSVLTLAGGALFGLAKGTAIVFTAATLGSALAFLVARYLARPMVERRIRGNPRFAAIDRAIESDGLRVVFLLRLSPVFPFTLLNYALGLTGVRFRDYLLASAGMLPGSLLYVYYGKVAGEVAALAAGRTGERGLADYALLALGLAATVAVTILITRRAKQALDRATADAPEEDAR